MVCEKYGLHMVQPSALYASSKYTKMANTVTHVLTQKECVQCAVSKYSTPSITNKAMCDIEVRH
ncbi:hypothetical protein LguiA_025341 [Lonicera macranthoides]